MTNRDADNSMAIAPVDLNAALDKLGVSIVKSLREKEQLVEALKMVEIFLGSKCLCGNNGAGDCDFCLMRWDVRTALTGEE